MQLTGLKWDCFPEHLWGHPWINISYSLTNEQLEAGKGFLWRLLSELAKSIPLPSLFSLPVATFGSLLNIHFWAWIVVGYVDIVWCQSEASEVSVLGLLPCMKIKCRLVTQIREGLFEGSERFFLIHFPSCPSPLWLRSVSSLSPSLLFLPPPSPALSSWVLSFLFYLHLSPSFSNCLIQKRLLK